MEHPGLSVTTIKEDLTLEEIQAKVREISTRLSFAHQVYNQPLINQLMMVLETYQRAYQEVLDEMFSSDGNGIPTGKIDVS